MRPRPREEGDGLSIEQVVLLVGVSVGLGAVLLLAVLGATGVSYVYELSGVGGAPDAGFSTVTEQRGDDLVMNVTHRGGTAVDPTNVVVEIGGERRGTWAELGGDGLDVVGPGHSLVLTDVTPGDEVRLLWIGIDEDEPLVLERGAVQDPSGS